MARQAADFFTEARRRGVVRTSPVRSSKKIIRMLRIRTKVAAAWLSSVREGSTLPLSSSPTRNGR
jgi:hypothetical protein